MKTQRKFLVPAADAPFALVIDAGTDAESRHAAFALLADETKREIEHCPDNPSDSQWQATIPIPTGHNDKAVLFARTKRDLEAMIDELIETLIDPDKAQSFYGYFASLRRRRAANNLKVAGDMITPTGEIVNIDSKVGEPQ